ncbi:hypothetical protein M0812_21086 [Anaeramoeba flamelloides]|uniref:Uncharacterized protein n=1 Tax=Anaeramoeba flamelloides TaxID=1746091 RepID=A0AAV7YT94_9EUKA|nr:hypothetical protein M0812_21086 [Anaeramoeba flamelloides]|eukprot:Anaeramoba_flamelloidesa87139_36.p1 GENE.a87139_36~~a87139_36.p1  ORF type:complete len:142 (-),score=28.62 a87139_36:1320-1745(-)
MQKDKTDQKKKISMSGNHNEVCVWHGQYCASKNSRKYYPERHGGKIHYKAYALLERSNRSRKKKQKYFCRGSYQLWLDWNKIGSPRIKTKWEKERKKISIETLPLFGSKKETQDTPRTRSSDDESGDEEFSIAMEEHKLHG